MISLSFPSSSAFAWNNNNCCLKKVKQHLHARRTFVQTNQIVQCSIGFVTIKKLGVEVSRARIAHQRRQRWRLPQKSIAARRIPADAVTGSCPPWRGPRAPGPPAARGFAVVRRHAVWQRDSTLSPAKSTSTYRPRHRPQRIWDQNGCGYWKRIWVQESLPISIQDCPVDSSSLIRRLKRARWTSMGPGSRVLWQCAQRSGDPLVPRLMDLVTRDPWLS